jgi:flagellar biosynthesis protein FlhG
MSTIKVDAHDQAAGLRRLFNTRGAQVVALTSAAVVQNRPQLLAGAAATLAVRGRRVLLLDENPAPRNLSSILLEQPGEDLLQVVRGETTLARAICRINRNLSVLAVDRLANAELPLTRRIADLFQEIVDSHDLVLIDCCASRTGQVSTLALQATHLVVAVTAASNGIMQAYAQIKRLAQFHHREHFQILVSGKVGRDEARIIFNNLRQVAFEHLGVRLDYLGLVDPTRADMLSDLLDTGLGMQSPDPGELSGLAAALGLSPGLGPRNSVV